jgi:hypothetical protein
MSEYLPDPPPNPTQCPLVIHEGDWRVWCEADVAGPCQGCPDSGEPVAQSQDASAERLLREIFGVPQSGEAQQ